MDIVKEFIKLQTCSEKRIEKIKTIIRKAKDYSKKNLSELSKTDVATYLRNINNSKLTQWTKNDYKKIFKAFLKSQYKHEFPEWIEDLKIREGFKCVSQKKAFNREKINKNTLIKPEELEQLLRGAKSLKWKALLTLLYESAFRPCELVRLKWSDLTFKDSQNICSVRTVSPKTKETRELPVQDCIIHLKRWREEYQFPNRTEKDFVFPNPDIREKHISEAGLGTMIKRICKRAEIRALFPYMFRHSRIYFVQKRLGARIASKYAGHSLETSEIYDHLDSDDVEEAMLEKVYTTKELTPEDKNEFVKVKKELKHQQEKINSLLLFEKQAKKIYESQKNVFETLMTLKSQGKLQDKDFIKLLEMSNKK